MNNLTQPLLVVSLAVILPLGACSKQPGTAPDPGAVRMQAETELSSGESRTRAAAAPAEAILAAEAPLSPKLVAEKRAPVAGMSVNSMAYPAGIPAPERENYAGFEDNPVRRVSEHPVSTFSVDVDTSSYSNVRRILNQGRLPDSAAVRVEEMINYFDYAWSGKRLGESPFMVSTEVGPSPWNPHTRLLQIGLVAEEFPAVEMPAANLVFLLDVSGSMRGKDKLGLLKLSLTMLSRQMRPDDRVSIVVYAGASGVVLEPVAGDQRFKIEQALQSLQAGGSTNGGAGIRLAYNLARQAYIDGGINRIILATDGDFNVGTTNFDSLIDLVKRERESGISLTTLGFGSGNYNDHLMEQLADSGNGNHAYIDTLNEARKVLVDELRATLNTVAKDVKIQIEFNPAEVSEYRLIGYENRMLKREDFNNDQVDAGEVGAGHSVTALYEFSPAGAAGQSVDPLRYGAEATASDRAGKSGEMAFLRIRYKAPGGDISQLETLPVQSTGEIPMAETSDAYRFASAVAAFGQKLRGGERLRQMAWPDILELARGARGEDRFGYRAEFMQLARLAQGFETH